MGGSISFDANVYKSNYQGYSAVINPSERFHLFKIVLWLFCIAPPFSESLEENLTLVF